MILPLGCITLTLMSWKDRLITTSTKFLELVLKKQTYFDTISSTPLTSTLGDSNGDFTVDVLDLVHDVDYILGITLRLLYS